MNWDSLQAFIEMGGYGVYVWGSFGVALVAMLAEPLFAVLRHRRALRQGEPA